MEGGTKSDSILETEAQINTGDYIYCLLENPNQHSPQYAPFFFFSLL